MVVVEKKMMYESTNQQTSNKPSFHDMSNLDVWTAADMDDLPGLPLFFNFHYISTKLIRPEL